LIEISPFLLFTFYFFIFNLKNLLLHKPYGYLSQFVNNQTRRKNKKLLSELIPDNDGLMAIGRLDQDSEGLLLITDNGKLSEKIRSKKVEKEYWVQVDGEISFAEVEKLQKGVEISINGKLYHTLPCKAKLIEDPKFPERSRKVRDERHGATSWLSISITEGKFRQVRKMTAKVGFPTLRLVRVRIGNLKLKNYIPGKVEICDDDFTKVFN
jgi:23S rRNA pseudouridine2457 synthase